MAMLSKIGVAAATPNTLVLTALDCTFKHNIELHILLHIYSALRAKKEIHTVTVIHFVAQISNEIRLKLIREGGILIFSYKI